MYIIVGLLDGFCFPVNLTLYIYGLLLLAFLFSNVVLSSDIVCPDFCEPCFKETLICSTPGRINFPEKILLTVERVAITNQKFFKTTLSTKNFTQFSPPVISLRHLSILSCNIQRIESNSFSDLIKLDLLDLSNNSNLIISNDAFNGLKLRYLIINNINFLLFGKDVFRGLEVRSLSLINCGIQAINYSTFHPLIKRLSRLFLQKNHIKTLEPKLRLLLKKLDRFELTENLLNCNCNLKWLIDIYKQKRNTPTPQSDIPKCVDPYYLTDRYLTHINNEEIICETPKISELYLEVNSLSDTKLICSGHQASWQAPMRISWYDATGVTKQMDSEVFINQTRYSKSVSVTYIKDIGHYKCVISNALGDASASVRIDWPKFVKNVINYGEFQSVICDTSSSNVERKICRTVFIVRRFSLLEIIGAIIVTGFLTGLPFFLIHRFLLFKCVWIKKKSFVKISRDLALLSLTAKNELAICQENLTSDLLKTEHHSSILDLTGTGCSISYLELLGMEHPD